MRTRSAQPRCSPRSSSAPARSTTPLRSREEGMIEKSRSRRERDCDAAHAAIEERPRTTSGCPSSRDGRAGLNSDREEEVDLGLGLPKGFDDAERTAPPLSWPWCLPATPTSTATSRRDPRPQRAGIAGSARQHASCSARPAGSGDPPPRCAGAHDLHFISIVLCCMNRRLRVPTVLIEEAVTKPWTPHPHRIDRRP